MSNTAAPKNLLILISDEHRKDAMGCVGHPIVLTPNLDALAARGTVFENAYTPSPMCVPTRASIACGDYVHRTRYWDSATPYDGRRRSWMLLAQASSTAVCPAEIRASRAAAWSRKIPWLTARLCTRSAKLPTASLPTTLPNAVTLTA